MKFLFYLMVNIAVTAVFCERVKTKIYVNIDGRSGCFRRMNGTSQIGCQSDPKGNVGVVHYIDSKADLDWLINTGPHQPYAVLLKPADFTIEIVDKLLQSGKVNGIMVIYLEDAQDRFPAPDNFSPDTECPNDQYGMYGNNPEYRGCSKVKWNPYGQGMMFKDLSIPIFVLTNETNVNFIIDKCYTKFNKPDGAGRARDFPVCAALLKDRMDGAKDSETCMRRTLHQYNLNPNRYCDPLGDSNVHGSVKKTTEPWPKQSVIVAATRLDSFSMFDEHYPGADSPVTGIVALLAAAKAIGRVKDKIAEVNNSKNIMFTFFQGEAFDYIGSGRMAYNMEHGNFEKSGFNMATISQFVEVNQLAYRDEGKIWLHTDPVTRPSLENQTKEMVESLVSLDPELVAEADRSNPLPPASVQSFLKHASTTERHFPAVVITDHKEKYTNKYYNSRYDLKSAIKMDYAGLNRSDWYDHVTDQARNLTRVANLLAKYLYIQATGDNDTTNVTVTEQTVTHLLYCLLISPNCEEFQMAFNSKNAKNLDNNPYPFYVGVNSQTNNHTFSTQKLLTYYFREKMTTPACCTGKNEENEQCCYVFDPDDEDNKDKCCMACDSHFTYTLAQGPIVNGTRHPQCFVAPVFTSKAESIAFDDDVLPKYSWGSHEHSTWTESSWQGDAMNLQVFLIPSKHFEVTTLIVGVLFLLVSLAVGYFLHRRSSLLFNTDSDPPATPAPVSL